MVSIDDELNQHYPQKHMDKFWKMAQSVYKKERSLYTDPQDIANCFKQTFSECCFDWYTDTESVNEL